MGKRRARCFKANNIDVAHIRGVDATRVQAVPPNGAALPSPILDLQYVGMLAGFFRRQLHVQATGIRRPFQAARMPQQGYFRRVFICQGLDCELLSRPGQHYGIKRVPGACKADVRGSEV